METPSKGEHVSLQVQTKLPSIPEDIMIDILLRLEVKSLVRFRIVSKTWYNLIKSSKFISMHHNMSNVSQLLILTSSSNINNCVFSFRSNDKLARVLSPDLEIPGAQYLGVNVVGSCNGIVCYYYGRLQEIFLSNPATREFKQLPCTSIRLGRRDQHLLQIGVAFGYGSTNIYDFKVLRVFGATNKLGIVIGPKSYRAEMFTLSSNTWKELDLGLDPGISILKGLCLFCANYFHFLARCFKPHSDSTIISCDIHTERFTTIDFPSTDVSGDFIQLLVFKEFLSAVFTGLNTEEHPLEIWIMKDYAVVESWTKLYKIPHHLESVRHLCFWMDDHEMLLVKYNGMNLTCHLDTLSVERIEIDGYTVHSRIVIHKESLLSIMLCDIGAFDFLFFMF